MKIAVLAWGSLVWEPGDLKIVDGNWYTGGPELPIELSRLSSRRGHLTYVIDERHKRRVPTHYGISEFDELPQAIANLATREECPTGSIGYAEAVDVASITSGAEIVDNVRAWAKSKKIDAVIWTNLPPTLSDVADQGKIVDWWKTKLSPARQKDAARYASRAPVEVDTDLRRRLVKEKLIPEYSAEDE